MNEMIFLLLVFGLPAAIGFRLALARGKNPLIWGLLCIFPFFIVVLHFEKPKHEIKGHFRLCKKCGEVFPWKKSECKYCGTAVSDQETAT